MKEFERLSSKNESASVFTEEQKEVLKERTKELISEILEFRADTVIFMDRSARPISWMMRAAWDQMSGGKDMPAIRFLNFGREKGEVLGWSGIEPSILDFETEAEWKKGVEEFWKKLDSDDYVSKIKSSLRDIGDGNRVMLVDDASVSGFSLGLAHDFLTHHFPEYVFSTHVFMHRSDENKFPWPNEYGRGTHLPWNTDKSYTLLSEDDDPRKVVAIPEKDKEKRNKGLKLKDELESFFI